MRLQEKTENTLIVIKTLIWLYFWMLIFEGAIRKWGFSQFSNVFYILRDPILLIIYFLALRKKVFPINSFILYILLLVSATLTASLFTAQNNVLITLYGVRSYFFHLPFIFLIPKVFNFNDVVKIGKSILILSVPMALLMLIQFSSPLDSLINCGVDPNNPQLRVTVTRPRPAGTFSFTTGAQQYFTFVFAFLIYGILKKKTYNFRIIILSFGALVCAFLISMNRALIFSSLIGLGLFAGVCFFNPRFIKRFIKLLLIFAVIVFFYLQTPIFKEGLKTTVYRFRTAHKSEPKNGGTAIRFLRSFSSITRLPHTTPSLGYGIGKGTRVAAVLTVQERNHLLHEQEWPNILLENGILLGILCILLRIMIVIYLGKRSFDNLLLGNFLPLFMFYTSGFSLLLGTFGQPTTLGFAVIGGGLCLAACRRDNIIK